MGEPSIDLTALNAVRDRVLTEAARFRAVVDSLIPTLGGRWVVFRDGVVVSDHASQDEAYEAGLATFGRYGGQVIAEVAPPEVVYSSLALLGF